MARRFGKRRKPRVNWLPTFGSGYHTEFATNPNGYAGVQGTLNFTGPEVQWDAFPLTFDYSGDPQEEQGNILLGYAPSLQDLVSGNEYRLRRIVGKCFIGAAGDELDDPIAPSNLVDVAAGFIVCKTYDDGQPTTDFNEVNPLAQVSMEDPWIWRRRWLLNPYGNTRQIDFNNPGLYTPGTLTFPGTTAEYGSVADGPHIDQKTARVIHRQERLFFVVAARGMNPSSESQINNPECQITYLLDYRLLGTIRPGSTGNRRNASR